MLSVTFSHVGLLWRIDTIHAYQHAFSKKIRFGSILNLFHITGTNKPVSVKPHALFQSSIHDEDNSIQGDHQWEIAVHHTALKTRNITNAILFYNLFGFKVVSKFRAGPAKAAWIELGGNSSSRQLLELIEVPAYLLNEDVGVSTKRAPDLMNRQDILGYNHVALDVTKIINSRPDMYSSLSDWIVDLNRSSIDTFGKTIRMALSPRQQMIGQYVFELAFILDADGCLVELLNKKGEVKQSIDSGWEPWDGSGFQGISN